MPMATYAMERVMELYPASGTAVVTGVQTNTRGAMRLTVSYTIGTSKTHLLRLGRANLRVGRKPRTRR